MGISNEAVHEDSGQYLQELEELIAKWEHATDPESIWILGLLREAITCERAMHSKDLKS